jgi:hypothetical protein
VFPPAGNEELCFAVPVAPDMDLQLHHIHGCAGRMAVGVQLVQAGTFGCNGTCFGNGTLFGLVAGGLAYLKLHAFPLGLGHQKQFCEPLLYA